MNLSKKNPLLSKKRLNTNFDLLGTDKGTLLFEFELKRCKFCRFSNGNKCSNSKANNSDKYTMRHGSFDPITKEIKTGICGLEASLYEEYDPTNQLFSVYISVPIYKLNFSYYNPIEMKTAIDLFKKYPNEFPYKLVSFTSFEDIEIKTGNELFEELKKQIPEWEDIYYNITYNGCIFD